MLSAQTPLALRDALERVSNDFRTPDLAAAAERLSKSYRGASLPPLEKRIDVVAYAVTRMPATYGSVSACLREAGDDVRSVLDLGAGTGAAAWAARERWPDLDTLTLVERNQAMSALGSDLGAPGVAWRGGDIRNLAGIAAHDLVVFSYSLGELSERDAEAALGSAWDRATKALLVVEPGTPAGAARIQLARRRLLDLGATLAAPCPHDNACPLAHPDWCHFAVRLDRTRLHRQIKGGELGYEDEKFSYVLATRPGLGPDKADARVIRHPQVLKGHIQLELCTPDGLRALTATKRDKAQYRQARKASWGSRWNATPDEQTGEVYE